MMKTKLTLFVTVLAAALFGVGCASVKITEEQLQSGLVAHYLFNGNAKDSSENALHGTLGGPLPTLDRAGADSAALKFNGVSDFIEVPHSDLLNITEGLTISVWVRPDRWNRGAVICIKGSGIHNDYDFFLIHHSRRLQYGWAYGSRHNQFWANPHDNMPVDANRWFQIVAVHDAGKSLALFVDGRKLNYTISVNSGSQLKGSVETPRDLYGQSLWIGIDSRHGKAEGGRNHYSGAMDELRIYNRVLSTKEVKALYDLEKPKSK